MDNDEGSQTMQATINTSTRQFGFNRFTTGMMALGIAVGIAIGATGATVVDDLPTIRSDEQATVLPVARGSIHQGEGLVAGSVAVSPAVRAHTSDEQGNGILGGNLAVSEPLVARTSVWQGEGILGGHASKTVVATRVKAYDNAGMGEGWLANGQPAPTLRAYPSDGQGEGWIANNSR
jgi:hypothetical protein